MQYSKLEDFLAQLEQDRVIVLKEWLSDKNIIPIFEKYNIDRNFFARHFGYKIYNYFLSVVAKKKEIGSCPAMLAVIEYFSAKKVEVIDIYKICDTLKKIVVLFFMGNGVVNKSIYDEIFYIFSENFAGVLAKILPNDHIAAYTNLNISSSDIYEQSNIQELSEEDKANLIEVLDDLNDYIAILASKANKLEHLDIFAQKLKKQAYMLITYGVLDELSHNLLILSDVIEVNKVKFCDLIQDNILLLESFGIDLQKWEDSFFNQHASMDLERSIIANVKQICTNLNGENCHEIEFFKNFLKI